MTNAADDPNEALQQEMRARVEKLEEVADKMGLYIQGYGVAAPGMVHPDAPDQPPVLAVAFAVGEQAFTDRVLNPEKYEQDVQTQTLLKKAGVDDAAMLRDELKRKMQEGKGLFDDEE